jgi:hypothetical protein
MTGRPPKAADEATRRRVGRLTGLGVASLVNLLGLRLAIVAGSVALGYGGVFFEAAQAEIDDRCRLSFAHGARIIPSTLADAPLLGAACVGWAGQTRSS